MLLNNALKTVSNDLFYLRFCASILHFQKNVQVSHCSSHLFTKILLTLTDATIGICLKLFQPFYALTSSDIFYLDILPSLNVQSEFESTLNGGGFRASWLRNLLDLGKELIFSERILLSEASNIVRFLCYLIEYKLENEKREQFFYDVHVCFFFTRFFVLLHLEFLRMHPLLSTVYELNFTIVSNNLINKRMHGTNSESSTLRDTLLNVEMERDIS